MNFNRIKNLLQPADAKIVLLVIDGLGGLPKGLGHGTELETAKTPNLDDRLMMLPPLPFCMYGTACLVQKKSPLTLMLMTR